MGIAICTPALFVVAACDVRKAMFSLIYEEYNGLAGTS